MAPKAPRVVVIYEGDRLEARVVSHWIDPESATRYLTVAIPLDTDDPDEMTELQDAQEAEKGGSGGKRERKVARRPRGG